MVFPLISFSEPNTNFPQAILPVKYAIRILFLKKDNCDVYIKYFHLQTCFLKVQF